MPAHIAPLTCGLNEAAVRGARFAVLGFLTMGLGLAIFFLDMAKPVFSRAKVVKKREPP
jgi:hypothetical protein